MLCLNQLSKSYPTAGKQTSAIFSNLQLTVATGELIAICGPNGCGKTTLLNLIAGLIKPDHGSITFNGHTTNNLQIGYVFQDYRHSLFPWLTVKDNITWPLKIQGLDRPARYAQLVKLYQKYHCRLNPHLYPYQLSGGQQQLVAILRGLIIKPDLYLLDEPLSSLDYRTGLDMLVKLARMWEANQTTTLFVSHNLDEAIFLAQRIILLGNKPTTVIGDFPNPLPYPRQIDLLTQADFFTLKKKIFKLYQQNLNINAPVKSNIER